MAVSEGPGRVIGRVTERVPAIDWVRGLVMVIMLLDHTRDFTHATGPLYDALDGTRTTPALYATRWVTHLCASTFVLLAGTSTGIQRLGGTPPAALSRFLLTRGLWLVVMELVVVRLVMWWNLAPTMIAMLQVIWAIGIGMIVLAALVRLPMRLVGGLGLVIIVGHNLLDAVRTAGWRGPGSPSPTVASKLWMVVHQGGVFPVAGPDSGLVFALYPLLPWLGVLLAGYGMSELYGMTAERRRRWLFGMAAACLALFLVLRAGNLYGDPTPWSAGPTATRTVMSFFNVQKYGPSLQFVCATLCIPLALLAALDQSRFTSLPSRVLVTYGRVPMFFYLLQWTWAHLAGIAVALVYGRDLTYFTMNLANLMSYNPPDFGGPLSVTYLCWFTGAIVLYLPCRWYASLKARRRDLTLLRYL